VEYSEFIDVDNMTCDFKNENFYRLLRFCKEHADVKPDNSEHISSEQEIEDMKEGKAFITYCAGGLASYSELRKNLGDDFHTVGITSDEKVKATIVCYRGMAMSEMSEHKDVAADFIKTLTDEEYQIRYNTDGWIRKDVLSEHVKNGWELTVWADGELKPNDEPAFVIYGGASTPLAGREDGSSYLNEFIELMDAGVPILGQTYIQDIILEESYDYFAGEKTEYEVADIIQSRIHLYLQERK
jgi:ABC-type glycerol-3-phosphate transport system substrate-binding protein